jgi:hypothetical protein
MSDVQASNEQPVDAAPASSEPQATMFEAAASNIPPEPTEGVAPPADGAVPATTEPTPAEQFAADAAKVAADAGQLVGDIGQFRVDAAHPALVHLQEIEDIAIHWGGDVGVQLRELVAKIAATL